MSTASSANRTGIGSVAGGAATGAAIGSVIPGVGTLVGAAVGSAVGGIAGSLGLGNKAKKYARRARRVQRERESNAQEATFLQMIREARLARAGSLSATANYGISSSSLATSALSSIGSQSQYSVQYTANDQRLINLYNKYMKKAGSYAKAAKTTLATGQLASMAFGVGAAFASAGATAAASVVGETGPMLPSTTAYAEALSNNLLTASMWNSVASPIFSGVDRYNQI